MIHENLYEELGQTLNGLQNLKYLLIVVDNENQISHCWRKRYKSAKEDQNKPCGVGFESETSV